MPLIPGFNPKATAHKHTRECVESQCPANLQQARSRVSEAYDQKLSDARALSNTPGKVPTAVPKANLDPKGSGRDMSQSGLVNAPQNVAPPPTQKLKVVPQSQ